MSYAYEVNLKYKLKGETNPEEMELDFPSQLFLFQKPATPQ